MQFNYGKPYTKMVNYEFPPSSMEYLEDFIDLEQMCGIKDYEQEELLVKLERMYQAKRFKRQQLETQEIYELDFRLY